MKNCIFIYLLMVFVVAGCNNEDNLTPTLKEINWADSLDMSHPDVKSYYEKYGFGLMTKFDSTRDIRYNIDSYWKELLVSRLERTTEIDSAIDFFNESLLQYFTNDKFIKECFPRKIILAREVFLDKATNDYCTLCQESDARVSAKAINSLHSIFCKSSFVFSMKLDAIHLNPTNYKNYKMDNLYLFLAYLFEINDLYDVFGADFYLPGMADCYGRNFSGPATIYTNNRPGVYIEDGGLLIDKLAFKEWYWDKGFVSTKYINPLKYGLYVELYVTAGLYDAYRFPDKKKEVRMLINQMLFVTKDLWNTYPDIVKGRFAILINQFDKWGIDIRAINPVMEYAFPRQ